jgi:Leucine-rich repeat (LRR) protein
LLKRATNAKEKHLIFHPREPTKNLNLITYLSLDGRNIDKIENLSYCTVLSVLYLSENHISNLLGAFTG